MQTFIQNISGNTARAQIMRRVYFIFAVRKAMSLSFIKGYLFAAALLGFFSTISLGAVIHNTPSWRPSVAYGFYSAAFMHAGILVQLMLVAAIIVGVWLMRDILKNLKGIRVFSFSKN